MSIKRYGCIAATLFAVSATTLACGSQTTPLPIAAPINVTSATIGDTEQPAPPTPTRGTDKLPPQATPSGVNIASPNGPWLVFATDDALWMANADGSRASQLAGGFGRITAPVAAPFGGYAAYVTARAANSSGLELHLLSLPSGKIRTITPLTSAATAIDPYVSAEDLPGSPNMEIARAILDVPSLAWSPDGKKLAFIGAMKGASADLYVYALADGSIKQLTDGPSQGYQPIWSPDGKAVVHAGADGFGTGAGYAMAGVWSAQADGSGVKTLYKPDSGNEVFAGWVSNSALLVYSWGAGCGPSNLRTIDIASGKINQVWPGAFAVQGSGPGVAYDPATGATLIVLDEFTADALCTSDGQPQKPGLYLTNVRRPGPLYLSDVSAISPVWNKKLNLFLASTEDGAIQITTGGGITALPAPTSATPVISPDGAAWVWAGSGFGDKAAGLWIGPVGQKLAAQVSNDAVYYATWSPDSQRVFFFADDGLYVTDRAGGKPVLLTDARSASGDASWVLP